MAAPAKHSAASPPPPLRGDLDPDAGVVDDIFMRRVLRLTVYDQDTYELKLNKEAEELGLTVTTPRVLTAPSPPSHQRRSSVARDGRSNSADSTTSQSSRLTSDFSKSWDRTSTGFNSPQSHHRRGSVTSNSSRSHDSVLSQTIPAKPQSRPSLDRSADVSRSSSPHRTLLRRLSRLRFRRQDSPTATSCCHECEESLTSGAAHDLPCGHSYCAPHLFSLIDTARARDSKAWPTCCGRKIPKTLIHQAQCRRDQTALGSHRQSSDPGHRSSIAKELDEPVPRLSVTITAPDRECDQATAVSNLNKAMDIPQYAELRHHHRLQRDRLLRWDSKYRADLTSEANRLVARIPEDFDRQHDDLVDKHMSILANVEDKHVVAEAELRTAHDTERRNTGIVLRHMEAYCRGESANGELHGRTVSEKDRIELVKAQRLRDNMDIRHESAINVLRGEQNHRLRLRHRRHDQELEQIQRRREMELDRIPRDLEADLKLWAIDLDGKKSTLERWWKLETQICLKKHGKDAGLDHDDPIAPLTWEIESDGDAIVNTPTTEAPEAWEDDSTTLNPTPAPASPVGHTIEGAHAPHP